jgi:hypothetical protein
MKKSISELVISKDNNEIADAMKVLTNAMQETKLGSYAHAWHCNIAMSVYDECMKSISHEDAHRLGNDAATRFMYLCFGVKTKNT